MLFRFMKNKTAFIAICVTVIAAIVILFMLKKAADETREASRNILEEFKKADENLRRINDSIKKAGDSLLKGTGAVTIDTNITQ